MLKVGIVGGGGMGSAHAARYQQMPDVELIGVYDGHPERASKFAARFEVEQFEDLDAMIGQADFIDICTPTPEHLGYLRKAAEAKKPFFVEKPLARTVEQCREAIEIARQHNVKCMPGHVLRFFPEFARAHEIVQSGALGKIAAVRTRRGGAFPRPQSDWYNDFEQSGGVMMDLIIHDFDWIRWTFGEVERVYAKALTPKKLDHLDYSLVMLRMQSGAIVHVEGTWADPGGFRVAFEIAGDKGLLDYDSRRAAPLSVVKTKTESGAPGVAVPESPGLPDQDPYYLELRRFVDTLQAGNDAQPPIKLEDGLEAVKISLAAIESAETGRVITINGGQR